MRYIDIKRHLKPYEILGRRRTTLNHAFAAAIAPVDSFDKDRVRDAISTLGQNPEADLCCAYCGRAAETWDHIHGTAKNSEFSGYGHRLGNLLPCCKPCNSKKGNRDWRSFLLNLPIDDHDRIVRIARIEEFLQKFSVKDSVPKNSEAYEELRKLRTEVLQLMKRADELAKIIRQEQETITADTSET